MSHDRLELLGPWSRPVVMGLGSAVKVGRAPQNDVVIDHPSVSRSHAVLEFRTDATVVLRDLGSSNGSRVDGKVALKEVPAAVLDGATLALGDVNLTVRLIARGTPIDVRTGRFESRGELRKLLVELEHAHHGGTLEINLGEKQRILLGYASGLVIAARATARKPGSGAETVALKDVPPDDDLEGFDVVDEIADGAWAHRGTYRISDELELPKQPLRVRMTEVLEEEPTGPPQRDTERWKRKNL